MTKQEAISNNLEMAEEAIEHMCEGMECEPFEDCTTCPAYYIKDVARAGLKTLVAAKESMWI